MGIRGSYLSVAPSIGFLGAKANPRVMVTLQPESRNIVKGGRSGPTSCPLGALGIPRAVPRGWVDVGWSLAGRGDRFSTLLTR